MPTNTIRKPYFAGQFYPSSAMQLRNQIESFVDKKAEKKDAVACMLPHAGYMYSGRVAARTASEIAIRDTVVLLGPNHTGFGEEFSIMPEGIWQTPLGDIEIDSVLAREIIKNSGKLKADFLAHAYEHSLEVELPILQFFKSDFKIVAIALLSDDIGALKEIGSEIAGVLKGSGREKSVLIAASSDMTHYEPRNIARKKDEQAIRAILELNEDKLIENIKRLNISMCGYAPAVVMLKIAKLLGAKSARLAEYQTSGEITGDEESVVGYAGMIIY